MSVEKDFIFDVIVNKISFDNQTYYLEELVVDVKFADIDFAITSSRIDVTQFREGRSCTFKSNIEDLKTKLIENPLKITVRHFKDVVGEATIEWPPRLLERLCEENFASHSHFEEKELEKDGEKIGNIIVICKLQCKCVERSRPPRLDKPLADEGGKLKICDELERIVDPNDVLFVIGDTLNSDYGKNTLGQCGNEQCRARLDVSRYRNVKGRLVDDPSVVSPCGNLDCCTMKFCNEDCDDLINEICKTREANKRACRESLIYNTVPQFDSEECVGEQRMCRAETHRVGCPHKPSKKAKVCRCCSESSSSCSESESDTGSSDCRTLQKPPFNPENKMPQLTECSNIRPKFCPICCEDISWLPKYAACVKCGYKPLPYEFKDKDYDEKLTADDILKEWGTDFYVPAENGDKKNEKVKRCTCKEEEKLCAYCRIKKITRDLLCKKKKKRKICDGDKTSGSSDTDDYDVAMQASDICENMGHVMKTEIPNLTKTLEDLKERYGAGVTRKGKLYDDQYTQNKYSKLRDFCEQQLNSEKPRQKGKNGKKNVRKKSSKSSNISKNIKSNNKRESSKNGINVCFASKLSKHCDCAPKKKKNVRKSRLYSMLKSKGPISERHKMCVGQGLPVPKNMGWLWTESEPAKKGWTPGAISKPIKVLMTHFLKDYPTDNLAVTRFRAGNQSGKICEEEKLVQRPTLHITKKNGEYMITMRPLKDPDQLEVCPDPYAKVKPIQFKICKNPMVVYKRNVKKILKERGFRKCCCGQTIACCCCRTFEEKQKLECEVNKVCQKLCIQDLSNSLVLSDTTDSDSELDVEFTPPAGLIRPFLEKKPDTACQETQYIEDDYKIKHFVKKRDRLQKACEVAAAARGAGGAGGAGGDDSDDDEAAAAKKKKAMTGPLAAAKERRKKNKKAGIGKDGKDGKRGRGGQNGKGGADGKGGPGGPGGPGGRGKDGKKKNRCRLPPKFTGKPQWGSKKVWPSLGDPPPLICMVKHKRHAECPAYPCRTPCPDPFGYTYGWNPFC